VHTSRQVYQGLTASEMWLKSRPVGHADLPIPGTVEENALELGGDEVEVFLFVVLQVSPLPPPQSSQLATTRQTSCAQVD
jgi:hypothetical protein